MLNEILSNFDESKIFYKNITVHDLIKALFELETTKAVGLKLKFSPVTFNKYINILFPNAIRGGRLSWKDWLVWQYSSYKKCTSCKHYLLKSNFGSNKSRYDGLNNKCLSCDKTNTAAKKASKLDRTPRWADIKTISLIYSNCPEGYQVDHVVPLNGINVCGLHVENNLQYLTVEDNLKKSNKFEDN